MSDRAIVFFDGDCLLCQGALRWLNRLDDRDRLQFAPLQGETARDYEINRENDSMAFADGRGDLWRASEAVRRVLMHAGGAGWILAALLTLIPRSVRDWGYRVIARFRKTLVRKADCGLPEQGMREKMLP